MVLAGNGKHFSVRPRPEGTGGRHRARRVAPACGPRPRGSSATSRSCTSSGASGSTTSASRPSPPSRGPASPPASMLACMCDLIVASDDATFQNPVLRMTGAGVELLVEPWELGIRKAKEFLWTGEKLDAQEAWRLGLVNRVVPRAELARAGRRAGRPRRPGAAGHGPGGEGLPQQHRHPHGQGGVVEVPLHGPPLDAQHRDGHVRPGRPARRRRRCPRSSPSTVTDGAPSVRSGRRRGRRTGRRWPASGCSTSAPGSAPRSAPACWATWAPTSSRSRTPRGGDFMRTIGPFAPTGDDGGGPATRCGGRSRDAGAGASPWTSAARPARTCSVGWRPRPTSSARTSGPGPWSAGTSAPATATPGWCGRGSACSARTARTPGGPGSTAWGSPTAASST